MADDGRGLGQVERLALRQTLDDVDEDHVGQARLGDALGYGRAHVSGADDCYLGACHEEVSPRVSAALTGPLLGSDRLYGGLCGGPHNADMPPVIRTEKLTKFYGKHRGIVDVDLTVDQGELFGFLGPNGAGKTTMIRTLLDHIRPTSGRATVFDIETTADPVAIHARLGYLPGEFALYDRLTGGQTLEYFANLRGGVDRSYQRQLVERLDVDTSPQVPRVLEGQQAEDRAGHRLPAQARPAAARRANLRPGSARPARVLRDDP